MTRKFRAAAAAAALLASGAALAQGKIVLRMADSYPAKGHYFSEPAGAYFREAVTKATNGQVEFQHFPAEQLGKARDLLSLTVSGVADIGSVMPSYAPDKMPLSAVAELPGVFATSCEGTMAFWRLARDGILAQREFAPNGIRILIALAADPYQALMKQPLQSVKELEGKKLRSLGAAMDLAMRALKATPVRMAAPEIYEAMSRGTVDGTIISYGAAVSYDLGRLAKAVTVGESFGSAVLTFSISETKWKSLPANVQQAMAKAGEDATRRACEMMDKNTASDLAKLQQVGVTPVKFSAADKSALQSMFANVGKGWAEDLDKRGRPGTEVLKAYQGAVQSVRK